MKRYNLSTIMKRAWEIFHKEVKKPISFAEALHRSWEVTKAEPENARRIEEAKAAAGVTEEVKTWFAWKQAGYMVNHGSKALFGVELIYASKGDGKVYKASFFGASQVAALA